MKIYNKTELEKLSITWLKAGQSAPLMQGMALNRLQKEYPTKKERAQGYVLFSPKENENLDLPEACYYLIERKTKLENEPEPLDCLIAFQECGDCIEGVAIFK